MDAIAIIALNGLALGLSSTLHCAGMCGAISCSLLLAQETASHRSLRTAFALTHAGRVAAYTLAGAIVGAIGAPAIGALDRDVAFRLLQWAGAASLIWIGLSTGGLVPSISIIDRGLTSIADAVARVHSAAQQRMFVPLLSGLAWGLMPCAMVYAALFTAMLTGSAVGGAVIMGAFGIGTLPGLIAASFGLRRLARVSQSRPQRIAAGLALAAFGVATVLIVHPHAAYLCLPERVTGVRDKDALGALDRHQSAPGTTQLRFVQRLETDHP
jgi:sulfite exporter TauE/SafE